MVDYKALSDKELVALLKADDRAAFEAIYRRYWRPLLDSAWKRLSDAGTAEELVQEVFISLYVGRITLEIHSSLPAYLKAALKYKIFNEYRSRLLRRHSLLDEEIHAAALTVEPNGELDARELERLIDEKVEELSGKCREVFILSRREHLTHEMIAERLGISVSTVEKHIGKALRIVRAHVADIQMITLVVALHQLR